MSDDQSSKPILKQWSVKYRPQSLDEMILPSDIKVRIKRLIVKKDAHAILITGRSGSGKTTLARILAWALVGVPYGEETRDVTELNVANHRGIDDVRRIAAATLYLPSKKNGRSVFVLDEVHALTGDAASALLKPLEEPPPQAIWILATNQPQRLEETIRNRCQPFHIPDPSPDDLRELLGRILQTEEVLKDMSIESRGKLIAACVAWADNVPRTAIQLLHGAVSSARSGDDIDSLIENLPRTSVALEGREPASLIVLAVLRAGEGHDNLKAMMSYLMLQDGHRLIDQLLAVTTGLIVETSTGERQNATYFFDDKMRARLQHLNIEHLGILLQHLINAKTAAANNGVDARSFLVNALLSARAELLALAFQLPTPSAVTTNGSVGPRVIAKN